MGSGSELPLRICMVWLVAGLATAEALRCYECADQETSCGSADNSPGRVRECPNSTMCSTTMLTTMVNGNEWIRDMYRLMDLPEGCKKENGMMYCNCRGELCNTGSQSSPNFRLPFVLILLALVCGKILLPV
ncbi:uncharacterized protein LOC27206163 isoform X2 [Drosophila simulans]|uniref:uncharacterized protein LOC27206163 isoform X2 n=1 Tax=Drosophila simulans TaxID=7240 RepID=UPI00192CFC77|nr:uncharacterized protein LOC27206163 isoform X2 [Drosophila simulans]